MSNFPDPFADEAQQAPATPEPSPWGDEPSAPSTNNEPTKERIIVQNNSEGKVVVTLKGGNGYDQSWIVIHAEDAAEAAAQLEDVDSIKRLIVATRNAERYFHSTGQQQGGAQSNGGGQQSRGGDSGGQGRTKGRPQGAAQAPDGEVRYCDHGEMVFKSGTGKNGKPWKAFMCPAPRGSNQCDPEWLR